jgi:hypothetical protein
MGESGQRIFVHVGVPKSGTTFLQSSLARNGAALRRQGVLYPAEDPDLMFHAALDVRGNHKAWGRKRSTVEGAWDELCARARKHRGTTVVSHELLAAAEPEAVAAALARLGDLEVHVIVTARDPARQVVAEWQEGVKHGRGLPFAEFARKVLDDRRGKGNGTGHARRFAASQDLPAVLQRWGDGLPVERVHLITCPEPESDRTELLALVGGLVGFHADDLEPVDDSRTNRALGVVETDLLRRVNLALDKRLVQPDYGRLVKHWFAAEVLAPRSSPRPRLPAELHDHLVGVGEEWVKQVDRAGWTVHGDLRRLVPAAPDAWGPHPDEVDPLTEVEKAAATIAELLLEVHRSRDQIELLLGERTSLAKKRKALKKKLAALREPG